MTHQSEPATLRPAAYSRSVGWVLRRALIGVALLAGFAIGGAMLLNASIDRAQDALTHAEE